MAAVRLPARPGYVSRPGSTAVALGLGDDPAAMFLDRGRVAQLGELEEPFGPASSVAVV